MRRMLISLIVILTLVAIVLVGYFYFAPNDPKTPPLLLEDHHIDQDRGFEIDYPSSFLPQVIAEDDAAEVSLEIEQSSPELMVTVWQESGLGLLETFSSKPLLKQLRDNVDRRFTSAYPKIEKEGVKDAILGGEEAFSVQLTFLRPKASSRERMFLTVTTKNDSAYYVQCLGPVDDWDRASEACFAITQSFKFL